MNVANISQSQTNSFLPVFTRERNGNFKAPASSEKEVFYQDFEILDFKSVQIEENQSDETISNQIEVAHIEKIQIKENIQLEFDPPRFDFSIEFSDFEYSFNFKIIEFGWNLNSKEIILRLSLGNKLIVKAILEGFWERNGEPKFQLKNFGLQLEEKQETPISMFLTSTLWAVLGLSSNFRVRIPQLNYDLTASFELPLNELSKLLQERQIAYRLMVIETALRIQLPFPQGFIDGKDVENIAFCYHAIVDREFDWFFFPTIIPWEANEESLSWLPKKNKPTSITFRPEFLSMSIFGIEIPLGVITAKIEKAVIDNYEEVKERLSKLDNSIVEVKLRSLNGISRTIAFQVPTLPKNSWSKDLQNLIDLDNKLDSKLLDRFFNLASSTLEGLTEEQKVAILERPDLDEDAFEI